MSLINGEMTATIILIVNIIFILLSIKCIFFGTTSKKKENEGQGIARKLVECIIENAQKHDKELRAECSYAKKVIENKKI